MEKLDRRKVIVELDVADKRKRFEGMAITFSITKTGNAQANEATIKIANLAKADRDYVLTATSPLRRHKERKKISLYAGYEATGVARLFVGDITGATVTQPPDIWLEIKAKTGHFSCSKLVSSTAQARENLSALAGNIAGDMGLQLDFQAEDRAIGNYSFTGGAGLQVAKLGQMGLVNAYVDDDRLVIKDDGQPLKGKLRKLSEHTGMIGIPALTEQGVKVKMLLDTVTALGGCLEIESSLNPAANGRYTIFKLTYSGESHGTPYYIEAEAKPAGRRSWRL